MASTLEASLEAAQRLLAIAQKPACYEWLFGDEEGERLAAVIFENEEPKPAVAPFPRMAQPQNGHNVDSRLGHRPTPAELGSILSTESNGQGLHSDYCTIYVPQGEHGEFVHAVMYSTMCVLPFLPGVTPCLAHRLVGFRLPNGHGWLTFGQDSTGAPVCAMGYVPESGEECVEVFHNLRMKDSGIVFASHASLQSGVFLTTMRGFFDQRTSLIESKGLDSFKQTTMHSRTTQALRNASDAWAHLAKSERKCADGRQEERLSWESWAHAIARARNRYREHSPFFIVGITDAQGHELYSEIRPSSVKASLSSQHANYVELQRHFVQRICRGSPDMNSHDTKLLLSVQGLRTGGTDGDKIELSLERLLNAIRPTEDTRSCRLQKACGQVAEFEPDTPRMQRQTHSPVSSSDACRSSAQDADSLVEGAQTPVCVKCGKHFFRQNELRRHIRTVHEREKTHKCPHCLKLFSQSSHLVTHVRSVHERRMDFPCNICKYRFSVRSNQLKHMRRKHGEDTASRMRSRSRSTSPGCQNSGSGNEMDTSLTRGNSTEEQQED